MPRFVFSNIVDLPGPARGEVPRSRRKRKALEALDETPRTNLPKLPLFAEKRSKNPAIFDAPSREILDHQPRLWGFSPPPSVPQNRIPQSAASAEHQSNTFDTPSPEYTMTPFSNPKLVLKKKRQTRKTGSTHQKRRKENKRPKKRALLELDPDPNTQIAKARSRNTSISRGRPRKRKQSSEIDEHENSMVSHKPSKRARSSHTSPQPKKRNPKPKLDIHRVPKKQSSKNKSADPLNLQKKTQH